MKASYAIVLGLITVATIGTGWLFQEAGGTTNAPTQPKQRWQYSTSEIVANGVIEGVHPEVRLRSEMIGRIVALHGRENTAVKKDQVLVQLDDRQQRNALELAKAKLADCQANLELVKNGARQEVRDEAKAYARAKEVIFRHAESAYKRAEALARQGSISSEDWDKAQANYQQARAEWNQAIAKQDLVEAKARPEELDMAQAKVDAAKAEVEQAAVELSKTQLKAPTDGRILQVFVEPGETVAPDSPQPVLIMADLSQRRVRAFIEEWDCARVHKGQQAVVTSDSYPGKEFPGLVTEVHPRMGKRAPQSDAPGEYSDVYFREVMIDLNTNEELPLNLRVQVRILLPDDSTGG